MFFSLITLCQSKEGEFWEGSPLFLNVTVLFAMVIFIGSIIFFTIKQILYKKKKEEILRKKAKITSQNQYFNANDDKDPTRPLAVISIPVNGKVHIAGNVELLEKLPHIAKGVTSDLKDKPRIDLFDVQ